MLKILIAPNKTLETSVQAVDKFDEALKKLIKSMEKTLVNQDDPQGVGLAANQVGKNFAIFIIKPTPKAKTEVFINPKIISTQMSKVKTQNQKSKVKTDNHSLEGCLSIPRIWGPVQRADKIFLEYQDIAGKMYQRIFQGFKAVIIQHEMDHLNGILFTTRALEQNKPLYEEKKGKLTKITT